MLIGKILVGVGITLYNQYGCCNSISILCHLQGPLVETYIFSINWANLCKKLLV
jgi:hypothetical protein